MGELVIVAANNGFSRALSAAASHAWTVDHVVPWRLAHDASRVPETVLLDPTSPEEVKGLFKEVDPDIVVNAIDLAPPECDAEPERARNLLADAAAVLAHATGEKGAKLVHLSTSGVFDGQEGWYAEDASPHPLDAHGTHHLAGEDAVRRLCRSHILVRTSPILSRTKADPVWREVQNAIAGSPAALRADVRANYIKCDEAARLVVALVERAVIGTFHLGSASRHTEHDIGTGLIAGLGGDPECLAHTRSSGPPRDISLNPAKALRNLGEEPKSVYEGLEKWVRGKAD